MSWTFFHAEISTSGTLISSSSQTFGARSGIEAIHLTPLTSFVTFSWKAFQLSSEGSVSFSGSEKTCRNVGADSAPASASTAFPSAPDSTSCAMATFDSSPAAWNLAASAIASAFISLAIAAALESSGIALPFGLNQAASVRVDHNLAIVDGGIEFHLKVYRQRSALAAQL